MFQSRFAQHRRCRVANKLLFIFAFSLFGLQFAADGNAYSPQSAAVLSAGTVTGAAGSGVDLAISLSPGSARICSLQFDLLLPAALTYRSAAAGPAATAAKKDLFSYSVGNTVRVLMYGLTSDPVGTGSVAVVNLGIAPGTAPGTIPVTLGGVAASDLLGIGIQIAAVDGAVVIPAPPDTTPPVMAGISAVAISGAGATISWTTNEPADSRVEYGATASYGSVKALVSLVTSHSLELTGLLSGTTYHYRVKSADAMGNTAVSADFAFATSPGTDAPPKISDIKIANPTYSSAAVSWTTSEPMTTQIVFGKSLSYGGSTPLITSMVTSHSQTLSGLAGGTTYHFKVKSRDAAGVLWQSADNTFTTVPAPDTRPPYISGISRSDLTDSQVTIHWKTNEPADSMVVYGTTRSYGSSSALDPEPVTVHLQTLTGLAYSTTYQFQVQSRDASGNLGVSNNFTFTTADSPTIPPVISDVLASKITTKSAQITWTTDVYSNSQVFYGTTTDCEKATAVRTTPVKQHLQNLVSLTPNTTYYYKLQSMNRAGALATSEVHSFQTAAATTALLVDPKLTTQTGREAGRGGGKSADDREFTGIALTNTGASDATLTITARDQTGAPISGPGIVNPVRRTLAAGTQITSLDFELFGTELKNRYAIGSVDIDSTSDQVAGFTFTFDAALSILEGAPLSSVPATEFVFPEIEEQGFTNLYIANPNKSTAHLTVQLMQSNGMSRASAQRTLPALGACAESVSALFPGMAAQGSDYLRVSSDSGIMAVQWLGDASRDAAGLSGIDRDSGATKLYSPQYVAGGGYRSALSIVNVDDTSGSLVLRLIGDDGTQIGSARTVPVGPKGKIQISDPTFFGIGTGTEIRGYVEAASDGPRLVGSLVFGGEARSSSVAAVPMVGSLHERLAFSHVAWNEAYFTDLALLNPNESEAVVTFTLYNADGTQDANATVAIPARQRVVRPLGQLFPQLDRQKRTSGYIRITADRGVAGFALFGTRDQKTLTAVPAQIIR